MPQDHDRDRVGFAALDESLREDATPPPPMPTVTPPPPHMPEPAPPTASGRASQAAQALPASAPATPAQPAPKTGGWKVDTDHLDQFTWAVEDARTQLQRVSSLVDQMQGSAYTPKLGTSPVGAQLEKKFADRVDAQLDDPNNPTSGGLRPMLAEAMRRMDEFVKSAEAAAKAYTESEQDSAVRTTTAGSSETQPKI